MFIIVTANEIKKTASKNDFRNIGTLKLKTIYVVAPYKSVVRIRNKVLSLLSSIDHEFMTFLYLKQGNNEKGNNILLINIIRNKSFFTSKGRYPNTVGAEKITAKPYTGINKG